MATDRLENRTKGPIPMSVSIKSRLPKGDEDGLQALHRYFANSDDREETIHIVARVSLREVREHLDRDDDPFEFVLGVDAIEAVGDEHADTVSDLIERLYDARTGKQPLPFPKSVA
jgi:hypothetical protein